MANTIKEIIINPIIEIIISGAVANYETPHVKKWCTNGKADKSDFAC